MKKTLGYAGIFVLGFLVACIFVFKIINPSTKVTETPFSALPSTKGGVISGDNAIKIASDKISKYVVNIDTIGRPQARNAGFLFQNPEPVPLGTASGVIISNDGYILTNNHVVANSTGITVTMHDERKYKAKIIGTDPKTDLAVVKIDGKDLNYATFGNSDNVAVGEWVIAVGNALGLGTTVTSGIISAKRKDIDLGGVFFDSMIQTDATINRGNSGGALSDLQGNLIGINTAIATLGGAGSIGIGFAVPSNTAKVIAEELIKNGKVEHPWIGIGIEAYGKDMKAEFDPKYAPKSYGILIMRVQPKSSAEKAGLKEGDVIIKLNDKPTMPKDGSEPEKHLNNFTRTIGKMKVGETVNLTILRNGSEMKVNLKLNAMPSEDEIKTMMTPQDNRMEENPYGYQQGIPPQGEYMIPFPPFFGQP